MEVVKDLSIIIAGVDEVGRGPLAGPVMAAAVILSPDAPIEGLKDSKKLSPKRRETLSQQIKQQALAWSVALVDAAEIDSINILQASLLAMKIAVEKLTIQPGMVLVDGNQCPKVSMGCRAIVGGDASEMSISAASIIAKVARDQLMVELHEEYPQYGFAKHKGYGTADHMRSLREYGPCAIHRRSFRPVREALCLHE